MASPKLQVFFLYDPATGAVATGKAPAFITYKDHTGADVTPPPITEIGGGAYAFTPVLVQDQGIVYCIDCGADVQPTKVGGYLRPEDYYVDTPSSEILTAVQALGALDATALLAKLDRLLDHAEGRWEIRVSGPDANRLIIYKADGSILVKFDLLDKNGIPTSVNPYYRVPVGS